MLSSQIMAKSFSRSQTTRFSPTPTLPLKAFQAGTLWPWWRHSGTMLISPAAREPCFTRWAFQSSAQCSPAASKERQRPVWRALQVFLLSEPSCQWVGIEAFMRVGRNLIRTQPCSEDCRWWIWADHPLFDFRMRLQGVHSIKAESSRAPASAPGWG